MTQAVVIGAGPVGLFSVFELGINNIECEVIDSLPQIGGQCSELYPTKPIYDIPAFPSITAQELVERHYEQIKPFNTNFHMNETVIDIKLTEDNYWKTLTSSGKEFISNIVVISGGMGNFKPHRLDVDGVNKFEENTLFYTVKNQEQFRNKDILISGGGDSALDWFNELSEITNTTTLIHRRNEFRAQPYNVSKMYDKIDNKNNFLYLNTKINAINGNNEKIEYIELKNKDEINMVHSDYILAFHGMKVERDIYKTWGLEISNDKILVDTEKFETNLDGIFAIGDVCTYPGKLPLILSGYHEAALMAKKAFSYVYPDKKYVFQFTTSSKSIQSKLGV